MDFVARIKELLSGSIKRTVVVPLIVEGVKRISDKPYQNFIVLLKSHNILKKFLTGTLKAIYQDRNTLYFKTFFRNKEIYKLVKENIEWVYAEKPGIKVTISKDGIIIYDNYKKNHFSILLMTIHAGTYVKPSIQQKMVISAADRRKEEDIDTDKLYGKIVLEQGGIWITNVQSRYYCDLNRSREGCVYDAGSEPWLETLWKTHPTDEEKEHIHAFYDEFYLTLANLLDSYRFTIIFDGHSMRDAKNRPAISFGTHHIPKFYLPVVKSIRKKMMDMGYEVGINQPYKGGFILKWLSAKFPDLFIFSMEINKKLYMTEDRSKTLSPKLEKIAKELVLIFDIQEEEGFR